MCIVWLMCVVYWLWCFFMVVVGNLVSGSGIVGLVKCWCDVGCWW